VTSHSDSVGEFSFSLTFEQEKAKVLDYILEWGKGSRTTVLDFSQFESSIGVKNSERVIVLDSTLFRAHYAEKRTLIGKHTDSIVDMRLRKIAQLSDEMILDGVSQVEFEHAAVIADGQTCLFTTYKRRLDELCDPNYMILIISRPIKIVAPSDTERRRSLSELLMMFQQLDDIDQAICFGHGNGEQIKDIAAKVGMTTRSVENRRQKIMDLFGFSRPVEIVKLLVRLDERGLL
jgi:hypothetical protein